MQFIKEKASVCVGKAHLKNVMLILSLGEFRRVVASSDLQFLWVVEK